MFALLAGGALFGFVGVLLAVPVAAVIGVGVRFAFAQYRLSSYYTGLRDGPRGEGEPSGGADGRPRPPRRSFPSNWNTLRSWRATIGRASWRDRVGQVG